MVELEKKTIYAKNMFGQKSHFDVNVLLETEDKKILVIKTWNGNLKKMKFDDKEKCYIAVSELLRREK